MHIHQYEFIRHMSIIHCTLYNLLCTVYNLLCTVYSVHCTLYIVHYNVYIHCTLYINNVQIHAAPKMEKQYANININIKEFSRGIKNDITVYSIIIFFYPA